MNFLAHYVLATEYLTPIEPLSAYVAGNTLPDLLPLASPRSRLRPITLEAAPIQTDTQKALHAGALAHLQTDTAFHKTAVFAEAQREAVIYLKQAGFTEIRTRLFFLAHLLAELALDAALLRADLMLTERFYGALSAADLPEIADWTAVTVGRPVPALPEVFSRFIRSRYLEHYADDAGVAGGIDRLCQRARQDTFEGENFARLTECVTQMRLWQTPRLFSFLEETVALIRRRP